MKKNLALILCLLLCVSLLAACGSSDETSAAATTAAAAETEGTETEAPTAAETEAPTAAETTAAETVAETTAADTQGNAAGQSMEDYLLGLGLLTGERTEMAAEMIGAESGFKYGDVEIYEFDESSDSYQKLAAGESVELEGMEGFGISAAAVNGKYVLVGSPSEEVINAFNEYK